MKFQFVLAFLLLLRPAVAQTQGPAPKPANGVYAVLREGSSPDSVKGRDASYVTLIYDRKYSEADQNAPPKYVALDASSFVPLVLARPAEAAKDDAGRTMLRIKLAPQYVKLLEEFTRARIGSQVAIVIDGEIVTMHKIRSAITDGDAKITRCQDNACEVIRMKLT